MPGRGRLAYVLPGAIVENPTGLTVSGELASSGGRLAAGQGKVVIARATELFETSPSAGGAIPVERRISGAPAPPHKENESKERAGQSEGGEYQGLVTGDGGPFEAARYGSIRSIASDSSGNLYVSEYLGDPALQSIRVRFINRSDAPVSFYGTPQAMIVAPGNIQTIAGKFGRGNSGDGGLARDATFSGAGGITVTGERLYVVGWGTSAAGGGKAAPSARPGPLIRMVNLGEKMISAHGQQVGPGEVATVAGGGPSGFSGDGGAAVGASLSFVTGLAAAPAGDLYLADRDNSRIRRVDPAGIVTSFAGTGPAGPGRGGFNGNDLPAAGTRLNGPVDVALGPEGNVFLSDEVNEQIRVVDPAGVIHIGPGHISSPSSACQFAASRPAVAPRRGISRAVTLGLGILLIGAAAVLGVFSITGTRRQKKGSQ